YENSFNPKDNPEDITEEIVFNLKEVKRVLLESHDGLFVELVEDLIRKVQTFGCYFTTLDIRQDSSVLRETFNWLLATYPKETGLDAAQLGDSEEEKEKAIAL